MRKTGHRKPEFTRSHMEEATVSLGPLHSLAEHERSDETVERMGVLRQKMCLCVPGGG